MAIDVFVHQTLREMEEQDQGQEWLELSLCANCRQQDSCLFLTRASAPILQCEMYECCALPRRQEPQERQEQQAPQVAEAPEVHLLGLCLNCENRSQCRLPKPPAGVWHCEEYR